MKKECTKCHNILPIADFHKATNRKDGHGNICKECRKEQERDRYANNKDRILNNVRAYRAKNLPEIRRKATSKYHDDIEHREQVLEYQKKYRIENKARTLEYAAQYREKNRDLTNEKISNYRQTKKGKFKQRQKYYKKKVLEKKAVGTHSLEEWENLKKKFNYTCQMCRKSEPEIILTEDHIFPISKGGTNWISNIQPLCRKCNSKKGNKY